MIKVSIIIPVYNTEQYLTKCLESLVNQTLKDIEIICIDDGSTDKSYEILQNFAENDSRIKIIRQENRKQGFARNKGLSFASGEYIGYVDSDDWVDLDYFEKLYNSAKKYDFDIALATNIRIGNGKTKKRLEISQESIATELQEKIDLCKQFKNECPTNKIYRRSFLEKNNIKWPENIYCEDKLYTMQAVFWSNGIVSVPDVNYYYFRRMNSTVKGNSKQSSIDKNIARQQVIEFLRKNKANIRDKEIWAITKHKKLFGLTLLKIKESLKTEIIYLFGFIPLKKRSI